MLYEVITNIFFEFGEELFKILHHLDQRIAIGQGNVAPHGRVRRGDPGKIPEPTGSYNFV